MTGTTITVTRNIDADRQSVWTAMTAPDLVSEWMMGARVQSEWKPGSQITWSGDYNGQSSRTTARSSRSTVRNGSSTLISVR